MRKQITTLLIFFFIFQSLKAQNNITEYEYWFDKNTSDKVAVPASNGNILLSSDVSSLSKGIHFYNFRAKDNNGRWSSPLTQYFYHPNAVSENKIIAYEYWWNHADSLKTIVKIDPVNPLELKDQLVEINALPIVIPDTFRFVPDVYGNAKIYYNNIFNIRFQDLNEKWSNVSIDKFMDERGFDVFADTLHSDIPVTKPKPTPEEIHFYKLNALSGDSLIWQTDQPCTIQVFDPFGVEIYKTVGDESLSFDGTRVKRDGVYHVLLHTVTSYSSEITLNYKHIHKYAILGYDIKKVGNKGISTINFEGNGFDSSTKLVFERASKEIISDTIICNSLNKLSAIVNFTDAEIGIYNIKAIFNDTTIIIPQGIEVEAFKPIELDVSIIGPSSFRIGTPITYTITVKNSGNITAYQVPLNIKIIANTENSIQNLKLSNNIPKPQIPENIDLSTFSENDKNAILNYYNDFQDIYHFFYFYNKETGEYVHTNDFFLESISPNSDITITVTLTSSISVDLQAIVPKNWKEYNIKKSENNINLKSNMACCVYNTLDCTLSIAELFEGFPLSGCVYGTIRSGLGFAVSIACDDNETATEKIANGTVSLHNSIVSALLSCMEEEVKKLNVFWRFMNKLKDVVNTGVTCGNTINSWMSGDCWGDPNTDNHHSNGLQSYDPNDKIGYRSPSGSTYFNENVTNMTYVINFENDPEKATAPAQDVYITDELDLSKFDINSFRAGYVMVNNKVYPAPYNAQEHAWEIDMRPEMNLLTRVSLTLDKQTGIAHWHFASIDPITDLPTTDVFGGFLPPNDEQGHGQGSVSFTIDLKNNIQNDDAVSNKAEIIFDNNTPIETPEWTNWKDNIPPVSSMLQPTDLNNGTVRLQWNGTDNGSGVYLYTIYARKGQENWYPLLTNTNLLETDFQYSPNEHYSFYVIATDSALNVESKSPIEEAGFYKQSSLNRFTISVAGSPAASGSVTGGGEYVENTTVYLKAIPDTGYEFLNWIENNNTVSNLPDYSFTVTSDRTLTAIFTPIKNHFIIATIAEPEESGEITGHGEYEENSNVQLQAVPNTGYEFQYWMENNTIVHEISNYNFIATANRNLTAVFSPVKKHFVITATASPKEGGFTSGTGEYEENTTIQLQATPNAGYKFHSWLETGVMVDYWPDYQFKVKANRNLVAMFMPDDVTDIKGIDTRNPDFRLYPNPAKDQVNLSIPDITGKLLIEIISMDGTVVQKREEPISKRIVQLNVSDLSRGIYIVRLTSQSGMVTLKLVLK